MNDAASIFENYYNTILTTILEGKKTTSVRNAVSGTRYKLLPSTTRALDKIEDELLSQTPNTVSDHSIAAFIFSKNFGEHLQSLVNDVKTLNTETHFFGSKNRGRETTLYDYVVNDIFNKLKSYTDEQIEGEYGKKLAKYIFDYVVGNKPNLKFFFKKYKQLEKKCIYKFNDDTNDSPQQTRRRIISIKQTILTFIDIVKQYKDAYDSIQKLTSIRQRGEAQVNASERISGPESMYIDFLSTEFPAEINGERHIDKKAVYDLLKTSLMTTEEICQCLALVIFTNKLNKFTDKLVFDTLPYMKKYDNELAEIIENNKTLNVIFDLKNIIPDTANEIQNMANDAALDPMADPLSDIFKDNKYLKNKVGQIKALDVIEKTDIKSISDFYFRLSKLLGFVDNRTLSPMAELDAERYADTNTGTGDPSHPLENKITDIVHAAQKKLENILSSKNTFWQSILLTAQIMYFDETKNTTSEHFGDDASEKPSTFEVYNVATRKVMQFVRPLKDIFRTIDDERLRLMFRSVNNTKGDTSVTDIFTHTYSLPFRSLSKNAMSPGTRTSSQDKEAAMRDEDTAKRALTETISKTKPIEYHFVASDTEIEKFLNQAEKRGANVIDGKSDNIGDMINNGLNSNVKIIFKLWESSKNTNLTKATTVEKITYKIQNGIPVVKLRITTPYFANPLTAAFGDFTDSLGNSCIGLCQSKVENTDDVAEIIKTYLAVYLDGLKNYLSQHFNKSGENTSYVQLINQMFGMNDENIKKFIEYSDNIIKPSQKTVDGFTERAKTSNKNVLLIDVASLKSVIAYDFMMFVTNQYINPSSDIENDSDKSDDSKSKSGFAIDPTKLNAFSENISTMDVVNDIIRKVDKAFASSFNKTTMKIANMFGVNQMIENNTFERFVNIIVQNALGTSWSYANIDSALDDIRANSGVKTTIEVKNPDKKRRKAQPTISETVNVSENLQKNLTDLAKRILSRNKIFCNDSTNGIYLDPDEQIKITFNRLDDINNTFSYYINVLIATLKGSIDANKLNLKTFNDSFNEIKKRFVSLYSDYNGVKNAFYRASLDIVIEFYLILFYLIYKVCAFNHPETIKNERAVEVETHHTAALSTQDEKTDDRNKNRSPFAANMALLDGEVNLGDRFNIDPARFSDWQPKEYVGNATT